MARRLLHPQRDGEQTVRCETLQSERDAFNGEQVVFSGGIAAVVGLIGYDEIVVRRANGKMTIRLVGDKGEARRSRAAFARDIEHALIRLDPGDGILGARKCR